MGTYQRYVNTRTEHNPCIQNLANFFASPRPRGNNVKIVSLDFYDGIPRPEHHNVPVKELPQLLEAFQRQHNQEMHLQPQQVNEKGGEEPNRYLKLLLVQDLSKEIIELLGTSLNIDPIFFASHVHTSFKGGGIQTSDVALLPSKIRTQNYINIHYHRTVTFEDVSKPPKKLFRDGNLDRKVVVLPLTGRTHIGLAQHSISILHMKGSHYDLGLILVDPPITDRYFVTSANGRQEVLLRSKIFLGGYESFVEPPSVYTEEGTLGHPGRASPLEDLVYYWLHNPTQSYAGPNSKRLSAISSFALKIVAGEWVNYISVMHQSVKNYEYTSNGTSDFLEELNRLNDDLRALQSWRRRSMSSQKKIRAAIRYMEWWDDPNLDALIADYEYLASSIDESGRRLENMLPVVASLVQVVDGRRSFAETANVSRLTILALVFVPLTYVSSLFSMNSDYSPGSHLFWIYFVVALPVTICVILVAKPPVAILRRISNFLEVYRLGRKSRQSLVNLEALPVSDKNIGLKN